MQKIFTTLLTLSLCPTVLLSDSVKFDNGDTLTGTLISLENGTLTFDSTSAGKVKAKLETVAELKLDSQASFVLKDGTTATATGSLTQDKVTVGPDKSYSLSELAAINPTPIDLPKLTGNLTAGLSSSHGNSFNENGSISADMKYATTKGNTSADILYAASRTEDGAGNKRTIEEFFTGGAKHELDFTPRNYAFLDGRYKTDHIADLNQRIIGTLGTGYRFFKLETFKLNGDLGISQLHEVYNVNGEKDTSDALSARLGYNLEWDITGKLSFNNNLEYYPSTAEFSDYYLSTKAEMKYHFNDRIFGSLKTILDYDAVPAQSKSSTDIKYIVGAGVSF